MNSALMVYEFQSTSPWRNELHFNSPEKNNRDLMLMSNRLTALALSILSEKYIYIFFFVIEFLSKIEIDFEKEM